MVFGSSAPQKVIELKKNNATTGIPFYWGYDAHISMFDCQ